MKYELTDQQEVILKIMNNVEDRIVMVNAKAGCAKTSTSLLVVADLKPKRGLYTAFNKAIVTEGVSKFTSNIESKTLHALALRYVRPKLKIEPFTYLCIKEKLKYPEKLAIINAMDEFFRSASTDMWEFLEDLLSDQTELVEIAIKYIEQMVEDKIPPTFNFLLKYFHLMLYEKSLIVTYDIVILDEIQDSTGVALEIFKLINSPKKLGLGDPDQGIYGFMNLVNGFEVLENTVDLALTHSFRCSDEIAERIETFGKKHLSANFEFIGTQTPVEDGKTAYLTRTNAQIVYRINKLHEEGKGYKLLRDLKEIFACPLALVTASSGKQVYHKKYKFLENEYRNYTLSGYKSFYKYLKGEVQDEEIHNTIDLLMKFNADKINIFDVLNDAKAAKLDNNLVVSTAFTSKGLEFSDVYIESDLNNAVVEVIEKGGPEDNNDMTTLKLYYVAASRARVRLHNAKYL